MTVVIDTNVILVANGQHEAVSAQCVAACATRLYAIVQSDGERVAIDDGYRILKEYQSKTAPHQGKRPGDAFLKWLLRNISNTRRCDQVRLRAHSVRGFETFPDDERLERFDPCDKKFVAVARAHAEKPPILQAVDSKWVDWKRALDECGVVVEFLCPSDIGAFDAKKKARKGRAK